MNPFNLQGNGMEPRIYHGEILPQDFAAALISHFNRGNLHAQQFGAGEKIAVQIATRALPTSGGQTALIISLLKVSDGVAIQIGKQAWLGVAASLGMTALSAWRNPWALLSRLDDLAQDFEYLQITEQAWQVINAAAQRAGVSFELSERLRRLVCAYCDTANPVGESNCLACGAPLGLAQPRTCKKCGFVVRASESTCPNCASPL
jgi:RNA polymerase subunit RPABC4/transcription elongation factor Spt4